MNRIHPPIVFGGLALCLAGPALAQTSAPLTTPGPSQGAPAAKAAEQTPAAGVPLQRVTVTGGAATDTDKRRESTAGKIIIGRDDIEKFGDTTLGEMLKRLPGMVAGGRPGRGGPPRMRGMGGGYTQIMVDGVRVAPGFSLDDIAPDQIERIEILRAPTAETGARAIAGTINVVTRGGYTRKVNDLRIGAGFEDGNVQPGVSWSRNDVIDDLIYNYSISAFQGQRVNDSTSTLTGEVLSTGATYRQQEQSQSSGMRTGINLNGRLQWRFDNGNSLVLTPMMIASRGSSNGASTLTRTDGLAPYDRSSNRSESDFGMARLNGQWKQMLDSGTTLLWTGALGRNDRSAVSSRNNFGILPGQTTSLVTRSNQLDTTATTTAKLSRTWMKDHNLVSGLELESNRRQESASTIGVSDSSLADLDGDLSASTLRTAAYIQDEWNVSPQWAAHAGLRWEGIQTDGSATGGADVSNRSSVVTPLAHAVYKLSAQGRDQVRISLTRSYRSPDLGNLIARPSINNRYLGRGANTELYSDRAGNADLKPELASGIDVAFEHYPQGGGLLSANVFYRTISNLIRNETALESVSWADVPRWVSRPQNIGEAATRGIELEARLRLSDRWPDAPKVDIRANASIFRSQVSGIRGPDNRITEQPDGTLNLGADYRLPGTAWTVGGNTNWTPGYTTQLSNDQTSTQPDKLQLEAYGLWAIRPGTQLRISASNLAPRDFTTSGSLLSTNTAGLATRELSTSTAPSSTSLQVRLEIKL